MKKLLLIPALIMLFAATAAAQTAEKPYIKVTGSAEREVMPDEIYLSINIDESNTKGKISVSVQEKDMIAALKKTGIDTDSNLKVNDMANIVESGTFLKKVNNSTSKNYELKVTSASQLADAIGAIQSVGVSNLRIVRTTHSELRKIYMELRVEAIRNARKIAESLAGAIDQKAGKAILIEDNYMERTNLSDNNMFFTRSYGAKMDLAASADASSEQSLDFKSFKLTYSVQSRFELE